MWRVVPYVFVFGYGCEGCAVFELLFLEEGVFCAEEVFDGSECAAVGFVERYGFVGVHFVALDYVEDDLVCLVAFEGDLLIFKEGVGFVLEEDFVAFGLSVVLGKEEPVDGVLGPVLGEVRDGFVVAFFREVRDDSLDECFRVLGFFDFGGYESVLDDDLAIDEELGEDEDTGMCAKGDFAGVAVAEKDFGFAGVFACAGGEG